MGENFNQLPDSLRAKTALGSMHEGVADVMRNNNVEFGKKYVSQDGGKLYLHRPGGLGNCLLLSMREG